MNEVFDNVYLRLRAVRAMVAATETIMDGVKWSAANANSADTMENLLMVALEEVDHLLDVLDEARFGSED